LGDLILINGEVKEAWRRLVKVLSKAMTGRTAVRERESRRPARRKSVERKREREGQKGRAELSGERERVRGGRGGGGEVQRLVCVRVYAERLSNFLPVTMRSY
jgi:hypothetical protein